LVNTLLSKWKCQTNQMGLRITVRVCHVEHKCWLWYCPSNFRHPSKSYNENIFI